MPEPESPPRDPRDELIDRLRADNAGLRADGERLAEENAQLKARLERLERLISRNSGNSSMPPSSDDLPGRMPPAKGKGLAGRKRGKQRGSSGAALERVAVPDRSEPVYPERGGHCARTLDPLVHQIVAVAARQQIDIPLACASVTEFRLHELRCGCGQVTRAELPEGVADVPIGYGPNLQTLCGYLLVFHAIPVERCARLICDLTGAEHSTGFVHGMLERAATVLAAFEAAVKTLLTYSYVLHLDETTLRVGAAGAKRYVWVACTDRYTAYHLGGRGKDDLTAFGVGAGFTGYAATTPTTGAHSAKPADIKSAPPTCCVILPMRPSATPISTGPPRHNKRCASWSAPTTAPARPAAPRCSPTSAPTRSPLCGARSASGWPPSPASTAPRPNNTPAAAC